MKHLLTMAALMFSVACFSQTITNQKDLVSALKKQDSTAIKARDSSAKAQLAAQTAAQTKSMPQPPAAPVEKQLSATMTLTEWQYLFYLIRTNGRLTGAQAEEYIEQLQQVLQPVKDPPKTK